MLEIWQGATGGFVGDPYALVDRDDWVRAELSRAAEREANFLAAVDQLSLSHIDLTETRNILKTPPDSGFFEFVLTILALVYSVLVCVEFISSDVRRLLLVPVLLALGVLGLWFLSTRVPRSTVRNKLVLDIEQAVIACAVMLQAPAASLPARLRTLDRRYRSVERGILRAHQTSATMSIRSLRHRPAREHAFHVAGALRREMFRIDAEPEDALRDLAAKMLTVGERYSRRLVQSLLPESDLENVEPVSMARSALKESAHVMLIILAAISGALSASSVVAALGIPQDMRGWCVAAGAVLGAICTGGWRRVSRLLELFPGK
ncbi:hypothetical protein AB0I54_45260 [Streptomyces sp. NPDC050625]|uniref:hypothetical protein n=1 Tax=Streptomyces sp. NPDC050625 TaxID=3154629 RepID=UPI0034292628